VDSDVDDVTITTTNDMPQTLYSRTLTLGTVMTLRATIVTSLADGSTVGRFVREFTAKRDGSGTTLLQDLVPSPDYQEDPGLAVQSGVSGTNATITVTGLSGTLTWQARIEHVTT
jgi:hypothetical protein